MTIIKGKKTSTENITLTSNETIKELQNSQFYKYLGVEEAQTICHTETQNRLSTEYFGRLKKVLKSELNSANKIQAINTWVVPSISYGFGVVNWSKTELSEIDRKTRNQLKNHNLLHNKSNLERLYIPRRLGGRGLLSIVKQYQKQIINLVHYLRNRNSRFNELLLKWDTQRKAKSLQKKAQEFTAEMKIDLDNLMSRTKEQCKAKIKSAMVDESMKQLSEMPLHGQHQRLIEKDFVDKDLSVKWLKDSRLKGNTESMVFAIQDQAIKTRYIEKNIYHTREDDTCRLCNEYKETIHHEVSGCPKYANTMYLKRHNNVAKYVYNKICEENGLPSINQWYDVEPQPVVENSEIKVLWDFTIQTDKEITAIRPDIVFMNKKDKTALLIDIAVPRDDNIVDKRIEKVEKYQNLAIELKALWQLKEIAIVPIIVGCTGVVDKTFAKYIEKIPGKINIFEIQKITLLGTCYAVRRFLMN